MQHSTIKVYLSAVHSLHIEKGFPDPLLNCLGLQRVLRGIKGSQGDPGTTLLPVTDSTLLTIFIALNLSLPDHCMFLAACNLAYFSFLWWAEFTIPNLASFSSDLHLGLADIAADSSDSPAHLQVWIEASKTDPFCKGCFIHIGRGRHPLCTIQALMAYFAVRGNISGTLFLYQDGRPLSRATLTDWLRHILLLVDVEGNFPSRSFRIRAPTVAACNRVPNHLIQALGRWSSNAYQLYIWTHAELLMQLSLQLT